MLEGMEQGREKMTYFRIRMKFGSFIRPVSLSAFLDPKHCLSRFSFGKSLYRSLRIQVLLLLLLSHVSRV